MNKLYFVNRPSLKGTTLPQFYYTFGESEEEAVHKVELKWGEYDPKTTARELSESELKELVIATNFFG